MTTPTNRAARAGDLGTGDHGARGRRVLVPVLAVVAVVVVALVVALVSAGGDDGEVESAEELLSTADISVEGEALPPLDDAGGDPAAGTPAPALEGLAPDGTPTTVEPGEPTLLAFLAHWCPHCQAELPRLVELQGDGALDGLRAVTVLTGTSADRPNFPPASWLEREGWDGDVVLDDESSTAAAAFGLTSYPFLVLLDAEGQVVARSAGELGEEGLRAFVAQAG